MLLPFVIMDEHYDYSERSDERSNPDPSLHDRFHYTRMCNKLRDHLDQQTMLELVKIPEAERPPQYQKYRACPRSDAHKLRNKFTPPSTWTYYDEDVVLFLAEA